MKSVSRLAGLLVEVSSWRAAFILISRAAPHLVDYLEQDDLLIGVSFFDEGVGGLPGRGYLS